jgi:hypothetical protein
MCPAYLLEPKQDNYYACLDDDIPPQAPSNVNPASGEGVLNAPCVPRNVHVDTHNGLTDPLAEQNNRSQRQIQAKQITLIIYLAHLFQRQGILSIAITTVVYDEAM